MSRRIFALCPRELQFLATGNRRPRKTVRADLNPNEAITEERRDLIRAYAMIRGLRARRRYEGKLA